MDSRPGEKDSEQIELMPPSLQDEGGSSPRGESSLRKSRRASQESKVNMASGGDEDDIENGRTSRQSAQNAGGCMERILASSFIVKICLWVAVFQGWFALFQAIWMSVDIPLDGVQSNMYRTASAFWDSGWVLDNRPSCNETTLKACWDNDVETCNGTVQFVDASGNISNYTNPNDNNKSYTMAFNCKLRLNSVYFVICLIAWMLPPVLLATSYVWIEVQREVRTFQSLKFTSELKRARIWLGT